MADLDLRGSLKKSASGRSVDSDNDTGDNLIDNDLDNIFDSVSSKTQLSAKKESELSSGSSAAPSKVIAEPPAPPALPPSTPGSMSGESPRKGLRRTNSYLQQREEVLAKVEDVPLQSVSGSETPSGKTLKRTQSYLERREQELRRLKEGGRMGSASQEDGDMSSIPIVSASNATSRALSRVASGSKEEWGDALSHFDPRAVSEKLAGLGMQRASVENSREGSRVGSVDESESEVDEMGLPTLRSSSGSDSVVYPSSGEATPDRKRPTLPGRPLSTKLDKGFKPQLQTIYSMRSEMDMNESMYGFGTAASQSQSIYNRSSTSGKGSFYNKNAPKPTTMKEENEEDDAELVPESDVPSMKASRPAVVSPVVPTSPSAERLCTGGSSGVDLSSTSSSSSSPRRNSFAGPATPSGPVGGTLYRSISLRKSISSRSVDPEEGGGGSTAPDTTSTPTILYDTAVLRKTIMTRKNAEGNTVEATEADIQDVNHEPFEEFVLDYLPIHVIQKKNEQKDYEGLLKCQLEKHLRDEEFEQVFNMSFEKFYALPMWRQIDMKKKHNIF